MQKRIALLYDFDYTLADGFMQQFGLMQELGFDDGLPLVICVSGSLGAQKISEYMTEFIKENPKAVAEFLEEYETSVKFATENVEETAKLTAKYGIAEEAVALKAIPKCNITFIKGTEMKNTLSAYLKTLFDAKPASIGGAMPTDDFYYVEK